MVDGDAQQHPVKPRRLAPPSAQKDTVPVTKAEGHAVFVRLETLLSRGLNLVSSPKVGIAESSAPLTRSEVVSEFNRIFVEYKSSFKYTPPKVKFDASEITLKDPAARPKLEKLIAWGTVAKLGPIASGSVPTLTVHQFGDSVGFFASRIAELVHLPPSRWTPYLNGGRG